MSEESQTQSQPWLLGSKTTSDAPDAAEKPGKAEKDADGPGPASQSSPTTLNPTAAKQPVKYISAGTQGDSPANIAQDVINAKKAAVAKKVKGELIKYLGSAGVAVNRAGGIKIALTFAQNSCEDYVAKYKMPDGNTYTKMEDVLIALGGSVVSLPKKEPKKTTHNGESLSAIRTDAHDAAKKKLDALLEQKATLSVGNNYTILYMGAVDPRKSCHNHVQIYPINYKAEFVVEKNEANESFIRETDVLPIRFSCAIRLNTESIKPVFTLTNTETGETTRQKNEQLAFRQFFPKIAKGNEPGAEPWSSCAPFSFFNLEAELLIEGMSGALACKDYQFHASRGYGTAYVDQTKASESKKKLVLAKTQGGVRTKPQRALFPARSAMRSLKQGVCWQRRRRSKRRRCSVLERRRRPTICSKRH
tara:strand:+ start:2081 stop:3337 length:1257 start_codon:yes stop_codon:yes gene_type:complete